MPPRKATAARPPDAPRAGARGRGSVDPAARPPAPGATSTSPLAPRRFAQARAQATYDALVRAAEEVFAERGFDAAQSPDIAARAGVAVGTFYRYFTDKRQAFVEMIAGYLAEGHAQVMAQLRPERFASRSGDHRAILDEALGVVFAHLARHPALDRVYVEMSLRDPEVARLRGDFERASIEALAPLIAAVVPREVVPDPRAAAQLVLILTLEAAAAAAGNEGPTHRSLVVAPRALRTALREMIHRYLFPAGSSTTKAERGSSPSATATSSKRMRPPWASTARRQK